MIKSFEKNNWVAWLIAVAIMIFIFYMSAQEADPVPSISFPLKAIAYHMGIFFLLALSCMIAMSKGRNYDFVFFAFLFSIFYALTDELHQYFVPGRYLSLADVLLDWIGIVFALIIYSIFIEGSRLKQIRARPKIAVSIAS